MHLQPHPSAPKEFEVLSQNTRGKVAIRAGLMIDYKLVEEKYPQEKFSKDPEAYGNFYDSLVRDIEQVCIDGVELGIFIQGELFQLSHSAVKSLTSYQPSSQ